MTAGEGARIIALALIAGALLGAMLALLAGPPEYPPHRARTAPDGPSPDDVAALLAEATRIAREAST